MAKRDDDLMYPEHPLFPLEEGGKSFEVSYISVARKEGGAMVWVPQMFRAEELTTTDQILERFGGGTYELYARSQSRTNQGQAGSITKRRLISLPGKPKPLDPSNATLQEEIAAGIRPNPLDVKAPPVSPMGDSGVLVAILQMNQQAAERSAQQSMQFMTMFMQMMQSSKAESAQMMQTMMTAMTQMSSSQQQSMMQMLPLLVAGKGGGPDEIEKYLGLFQKLGMGVQPPAPKEDNGESDLNVGEALSNVATILQSAPGAVAALKEMAGGGGPPNGAPQMTVPGLTGPVEAPLGSAASVLGKG